MAPLVHREECTLKVLLVVNAAASSVTARGRIVIQKALSADHDLEVAETAKRGHATSLARDAVGRGFDVVAVLGGDGTLNEAANGLLRSDTALAPLPGGSTNVFARTIGLPNDPIEATGALVDALARDAIRPIGVGTANGRAFLFHVGIGFDAAVVEQVEKRASLKRYAGHPLFMWATVTTWMRHYDRSRPRFSVELADGTRIERGYFSVCLNSDPYTFLGNRPFTVAPEATLDRGLVLLTFRNLRASYLSRVALGALRSGKGLKPGRGLDKRVDLEACVVRGLGPVPYQIDGDFLGEVTELRLRHLPDALRLVIPATA